MVVREVAAVDPDQAEQVIHPVLLRRKEIMVEVGRNLVDSELAVVAAEPEVLAETL
jgi:hypothetical protein